MVGNGPTHAEPDPSLESLSARYSWVWTDLSILHTSLSWARTAISLIGFGFAAFSVDAVGASDLDGFRVPASTRTLGLVLVVAETVTVAFAIWNFWSINTYAGASETALPVDPGMQRR